MDAKPNSQEYIYQRIGEFVVSFQWLENKLREIGWFILDPGRLVWPPRKLRNKTNERLVNDVHRLFISALPKCKLPPEEEHQFLATFSSCVVELHSLRKSRNRILHAAYSEVRAGGEVQELVLSNPQKIFDEETLSATSFDHHMQAMAEIGFFLSTVYLQLIAKYPQADTQ